MLDVVNPIRSLSIAAFTLGVLVLGSAAPVRAESTGETIRNPLPGKSNHTERAASAPDLVPAEIPLQEGERLVYDIRVNGVAAGKTQLLIKKDKYATEKGPQIWVVEMDTHSNRAVSLFYSVEDKARTNIDVKGGFTRFYHIQQKEGDVKNQEKINFKYDIGEMEATCEKPRPDGEWRTHKVPLPGKVLDPLSAIYYLRTINFRALLDKKDLDKDICLPICSDRRVWNTLLPVKGHGFDDFGKLKDREYVKIVPEAEFRGLFERKGKMTIWVDVETGIPLKMEVEIPIGHAEVQLSQYENCPLSK